MHHQLLRVTVGLHCNQHLRLPNPAFLHRINSLFHAGICYRHFVWLGPDHRWHLSPSPSPLLPDTPRPSFCMVLIVCYILLYLQAELTQKGEQLGEQTESIAALTTQRDQLTATTQRDGSARQSFQEEVQAKTSHVRDLEAQLAGQHKQLQSSQHQLQQQKSVQSKLVSQLELQAAELSGISEQASNLEVDKQQLQQKLDDMDRDQEQMQSRLSDERAAADKKVSALQTDVLQLQVNHLVCCVCE